MNSQHFRYWLARLRPIARPQTWMPLLGAGMVSGFVWVAYQSPESLSFVGVAAEGSADAEAIGADIDSVSVLMQEMGSSPAEEKEAEVKPDAKSALLKPNATLKTDGDRGSLAQLVKFTPDASVPYGMNNGLSNGLSNNLSPNNVPIAGSLGGAGPSSAQNNLFTRNDGLSSRISPLAQAIDRMNAQSYGSPNGLNPADNRGVVPIEGTGPIGTGATWAGIPVNGTSALTTSTPFMSSGANRSVSYDNNAYNNNAYNTLTGAPSGMPLPDPGIAMPIAPIGVPIAPSMGANSGMVTPFPVNPSETVNVLPEQVFSAPRPVPGRIIGGGTINTFSNP